MKIRIYKHQMQRWVWLDEIELYEAAGWSQQPPASNVVEIGEVVAMKAPAKSKGAAKPIDNAIHKGD
jgi:hypothetical protein